MKRLLLSTLIVLTSTFVITSCTEESVDPKMELDGPGGGAIDPIVK